MELEIIPALNQTAMRFVTLLFIVMLAAVAAHASSGFYITDPRNSWNRNAGNITSPEITITPRGAYAEVELTMTVASTTGYSPSDSLEAVLNFDLPAGSFIHNSFLWLTPSVVVQADIIDKGRAISIYEGIVKRRRDPSLLVKTGADSYQLNIFPLTSSFPRKVKIVYSVPFYWTNGRATVPLPMSLFKLSQTRPNILFSAATDAQFPSVTFAELGRSPIGIDTIRKTEYESLAQLSAIYTVNLSNGILMTAHSTGANAGVYQAIVDPSMVIAPATPRKMTLVLDHSNLNQSIYTLEQVRGLLKSVMLGYARPTDSFNLFYVHNNSVISAFPTWSVCNAANVLSALSGVPANLTNDAGKYEDLLKTALIHAGSQPGNGSQVLLFSNNRNYMQQSLADTLYNRVKAAVGSPLPNKIQVMNYSTYKYYTSSGMLNGSELLFSKLTLASGGTYYRSTTTTYGYVGGIYTSGYSFDIPEIFKEISLQLGTVSSAFSLNVPITGGFTYSKYALYNVQRLNMALPYVETGRYSGLPTAGGSVQLQVVGNGTAASGSGTISNIYNSTSNAYKAWVYQYLLELERSNTSSAYSGEIVDSSIRNRVLSNYTAFLALETSDTVGVSVTTNNGGGPYLEAVSGLDTKEEVKAYPNPFVDVLTLDFTMAVNTITIYDMSGRVVRRFTPEANMRKLKWDGTDGAGQMVAAGIYVIRVETASGSATLRVVKR